MAIHKYDVFCAKCLKQMKTYRNGVMLIDYENTGIPQMFIAADTFMCPSCGDIIIKGIAEKGFYHFDTEFKDLLAKELLRCADRGIPVYHLNVETHPASIEKIEEEENAKS